ncbi:hypothetical protein FACS1894196_3090 [Clostridia bacterium]|nr:hypothetical protein FACS1894196_3090 [Clostridia bacterium]
MAAQIVRVYREQLPALRVIGKRYTDADREGGGFGAQWDRWFAGGWFGPLEALGALPQSEGAYVGVIRDGADGFAYWIGMLFAAGTPAPEGYACADIAGTNIATCWLYGSERGGDLFGMENHAACLAEIARQGWTPAGEGLYIERYNCPRFTTPDDKGNVILDYCVAVR